MKTKEQKLKDKQALTDYLLSPGFAGTFVAVDDSLTDEERAAEIEAVKQDWLKKQQETSNEGN